MNKQHNVPKMSCSLHPYAYDDPYHFESANEKDVDIAKEYFSNEKRNYIFTSEVECLVSILYYDKLHKTNTIKTLFGKSYKSNDVELNELKRNCKYLIKQIRKEKRLNLSLFLWTIYKTYYYFRSKNNESVIDRPSFSLIQYLLNFGFIFFNCVKLDLVEGPVSSREKGFVRHMCGLLSNDLIHTIIRRFPDYYFTNIMFLGYGCYIPAGCSDLTTSMNTFDSFIEGICDYDFWYDEELIGSDVLLNTLKLEKDYHKLTKEVFDNAAS